MTKTASDWSRLWLLVIPIGLALCYSGAFYQTGAEFYGTCWKKAHANGREADSPEQAAQWAACEETANAALYNAGFIYAGNPEYSVTPQLKAVEAACPSSYSDLPIGGAWILVVQMTQDAGGPTFLDRISPASSTIVRMFQAKWPNCATTAEQNGFPKVVNRNGVWVFGAPCLPCKAQTEAYEKRQQENRAFESLSKEEQEKKRDEWLPAPATQAK
jgi:hypothetical protein